MNKINLNLDNISIVISRIEGQAKYTYNLSDSELHGLDIQIRILRTEIDIIKLQLEDMQVEAFKLANQLS